MQIGIIGLLNARKSTLFNALARGQIEPATHSSKSDFPSVAKSAILAIETRSPDLLVGAQSVDIEAIKIKVRNGKFVLSAHADQEAADEDIAIAEIRDALSSGEILEQYPDTGRGESCLILGFANDKPVHVVCGWHRESVVVITVYVPKPPKFDGPRSRGRLA